MLEKAKAWARRLAARQIEILSRLEKLQTALGRVEARQTTHGWDGEFGTAEFQVFSQWGEDGILNALVHNLDVKSRVFVEFGVQNYVESNTRFLLVTQNWAGLVIDGNAEHISFIKSDPVYWRHNLKADNDFITAANINDILARNGIRGEIGLLSIDIDGNDYWVWKAITGVSPAIVVIEYNARFGPTRAVTIPYDPEFVRERGHHSQIYYGASLAALCGLGELKGYAFVGSNSAGNNAFFVRRDLLKAPLREISAEDGFVRNQFREGRDEVGNLSHYSYDEEQAILSKLPLIDVAKGDPLSSEK